MLTYHSKCHISGICAPPEPHEAGDAPLQAVHVPRHAQQPVAQLHVLLARTRHARDDARLALRLLVGVLAQLSQPSPARYG